MDKNNGSESEEHKKLTYLAELFFNGKRVRLGGNVQDFINKKLIRSK